MREDSRQGGQTISFKRLKKKIYDQNWSKTAKSGNNWKKLTLNIVWLTGEEEEKFLLPHIIGIRKLTKK